METPIGKHRFENLSMLLVSGLIAVLFVVFFCMQYWAAREFQRKASEAFKAFESAAGQTLTEQKTKQEAIAVAIKNAQESVFVSTLLGKIAAGMGVFVTIAGSIFGLFKYLDVRAKEFAHTAATTFFNLWEGIASDKPRVQASALTGLTDFLKKGREEYYEGTLSALALVGRMHNQESTAFNYGVTQSELTIAWGAYKRALEIAATAHPALFRSTCWQGIKCSRTEFTGSVSLSGIDFRDADLEEADFSGLDLHKARFSAAKLIGAKFTRAKLQGCDFQHADLTGADFEGADLQGANLLNARILGTNFKNAILHGAKLALFSMDWRLAANWRDAAFDEPVRAHLLKRYGPEAEAFRILMLLWEYPSIVTGGGWTAAYHFMREMRARGANIVVLVPFSEKHVSPYVFGHEIEVCPVGPSDGERSLAMHSAYESTYASGLEELQEESQYYTYSHFEKVNDFANRALEEVFEKSIAFDVIHADDWLTFPAAEKIAKWASKPWVAHFHSTEYERRKEPVNEGIARIEKHFAERANAVLVPSSSTKRTVVEKYGIDSSRVSVMPNCLSSTDAEEAGLGTESLGEFHAQTVVFAGRLQWQKGVDRFVTIAGELSFLRPGTRFRAHGRGESDYLRMVRNAMLYSQVWISEEPFCPEAEWHGDLFHIRELVPVRVVAAEGEREYVRLGPAMGTSEREGVLSKILARGFEIYNSPVPYFPYLLKSIERTGDFHGEYLVRMSVADSLRSKLNYYTDSIRVEGFTPWEERRRMFENASVCVVPSRFEPFGLIVLESMAHGVPVVYPRQAGVAEFVKAGVQVDFTDTDEAVDAISRLLDDMDCWRQVVREQAEEVRQYVNRGYGWALREKLGEVAAGPA